MMEADDVYPEFSHSGGDFLRIFFSWKGTAEAEIDPEEANPLVSRIEMPICFHFDMTVFTSWFVMPIADIGEAGRGIIPGEDEGEKGVLLGAGRYEEAAQNKTR
jgi:hypothetical protein